MLRIWKEWNEQRDARTLLLFGISVLAFLGVGVGFYCLYEQWTISTSIFFVVTTLSAVGKFAIP
jgi:hypothetical protein